MLDDDSSSSNELLEDSSRNNGPGPVEDHEGSCTPPPLLVDQIRRPASMSITEMNWKKITWDDISCTEEEVNVINKDEKTRLKTILKLVSVALEILSEIDIPH